MEKELKDYLEKITGELAEIRSDVSEVRGTMATKEELAGVKSELASVKNELGAKIDKLDRRLTRKINDTLEYVKLVDEDLAAHRRNTEMHVPGSRKA